MSEAAMNGLLRKAKCKEFLGLCKGKVVGMLVFTAVVGMFMATGDLRHGVMPGWPPLNVLIFGSLGIGLAAMSAAAINHVVDQRIDAKMARTSNRPLPSGAMTARQALIFAGILCVLAMLILVVFVNVLTAVLTFVSLVGYAIVYTMYLKRATPQNIVIGGAAGAAPPLLGYTAVTGQIHPDGLWLFLIIFVWTPPHFWALAIYRRKEYARVDMPMLPVTHGPAFTRLHVLLYTILLLVVSVMPFVTRMSGTFYLGGALALGMGFLYYAIMLMKTADDRVAMKTFGYSILYLMGLFAFLLIDHYMPLLKTLF